jgi:cytochrome c biogenesis protein CcmG, thiol:disulfide interchange protein DsbE
MFKRYSFILAFAALGLAGCQQPAAGPSPSREISVAAGDIGSSMPEFSVKDLEGRPVSSADLRGKVVLIDFWAMWCQPCTQEMPGYQKLMDRYGPQGFAVIGFKFDTMKDTEDPILFAKKLRVHYPLAVASDDVKNKFGGILGLPTTMLYDRQGVLRKRVIGFEYTDAIESELKPLL